jgi:hypothetical protein
MDVGSLFDGLPEVVEIRTGIVHSYEKGHTTLDQIGIEEYSRFRFHGDIQGIRSMFPGQTIDGFLPQCTGPQLK